VSGSGPNGQDGATRAEVAELRALLDAQAQENALLRQMIADVLSLLGRDQVLQQIVEHLVAAVGCHGAFIYLWDPHRRRLVLRGASVQYREHLGRISLGLGEGLVGWSAVTRTPVMLRERAQDDPRFRYFPELREEFFQAILTAPVLGADGAVVAVISMHTVAPQEFTAEHVRLVGAVAPLLGGAIEHAGLYEATARRLSVLSTLSGLVQAVRSEGDLEGALRAVAETTLRLTGSWLCALLYAAPGLDGYAVRAYHQEGDAFAALSARVGRTPWERLARATPASLGLGVGAVGPPRSAPLVAAGQQVGLLLCYDAVGGGGTSRDDEGALLAVIATQAAIAIQNSQLADLLAERDVAGRLFRVLSEGSSEEDEARAWRWAAALGCDLARPHAPLVADLAPVGPGEGSAPGREAYRAAATALRGWLAEAYPGSLIHADAPLLAVVRLADGQDPHEGATDLAHALAGQAAGAPLVVGVGRVVTHPRDYLQGFAQAREALRVGRALGRVATLFDDLGAARYLSLIPPSGALDAVTDRYQEGIARLAEHDARRGLGLLETLETYLACGGNIARAAQRLYVHRNTLVQRLDRIEELLGVAPHAPEQWLPLQVTLALRRLRPPH